MIHTIAQEVIGKWLECLSNTIYNSKYNCSCNAATLISNKVTSISSLKTITNINSRKYQKEILQGVYKKM